jgi:branched-chain amino acid transport system ATP-binding protein
MDSLLSVEHLTRRYTGLIALDEINLSINEGGITGLIGPNGAGKTTLFSIIAGAERPSAGRIRYAERDITGWRPHQAAAAGVARTFQLMRVFGSLTVRENVAVGAYLRSRRRASAYARADEILDLTGLTHLADIPAGSLTAPSKKRLEIARALVTDPRLLLLDEVLAGLTPTEAADAVALLRRIADRRVTILMVEHVMEVIMPLCDRLFVLNHGQLISEGTPTEVSRDPVVIDAYLGGG